MTDIRFSGLRAMALDGDETQLEKFKTCLESLGFDDVMTAQNTEEARDQFFFNPCHVILMGARQSPCPAEAVIAAALRETRIKPVVVVAGASADEKPALSKAGASAVLNCTISADDLARAVADAAGRSEPACAPQPARRRAVRSANP